MFYCCSNSVVPIFPPLLSPALSTPLPHSILPPPHCFCSWVRYTCSLTWLFPFFPLWTTFCLPTTMLDTLIPDRGNTKKMQIRKVRLYDLVKGYLILGWEMHLIRTFLFHFMKRNNREKHHVADHHLFFLHYCPVLNAHLITFNIHYCL